MSIAQASIDLHRDDILNAAYDAFNDYESDTAGELLESLEWAIQAHLDDAGIAGGLPSHTRSKYMKELIDDLWAMM